MAKKGCGRVLYDTGSKLDRRPAIIFHVTKDEKQKIHAKAEKLGISTAAYCRLVLLNSDMMKGDDN